MNHNCGPLRSTPQMLSSRGGPCIPPEFVLEYKCWPTGLSESERTRGYEFPRKFAKQLNSYRETIKGLFRNLVGGVLNEAGA
jgi:hypothetical protein